MYAFCVDRIERSGEGEVDVLVGSHLTSDIELHGEKLGRSNGVVGFITFLLLLLILFPLFDLFLLVLKPLGVRNLSECLYGVGL